MTWNFLSAGAAETVGNTTTSVAASSAATGVQSVLADLDTSLAPLALYTFASESAADSSGNGYDLTMQAGSESYAEFMGKSWAVLDAVNVWRNANTAFQIAGDITIFLQMKRLASYASTEFLTTCSNDSAATSAENHQWACWWNGVTQSWTHQSGTKVDNTVSHSQFFQNDNNGGIHNLAWVRDATNKTVTFYWDGIAVHSGSYTNNPTGGSNTAFRIGGSSAGTFKFRWALIRNVWIKASALTATQIKALGGACFNA